jgi:hypothetical protein
MFGIAKKFNNEMEQFPLHTHSAICELIRVGMQHRNLAMQAQKNAKDEEQRERALRIEEGNLRLIQEQERRTAAANLGGPQVVPAESKPQ